MTDHDVFEIVLRVKNEYDYSTFIVDGDTDLCELETLIYDMLSSRFKNVWR